MIGYVKGVVTHIFIDSCFVDVHGVGYRVYVPGSTMEKLTVGREMLLFTYMSVREDAILLYGFRAGDMIYYALVGVIKWVPRCLGYYEAIRPGQFRMAVGRRICVLITPRYREKDSRTLILITG